jgi:hypothetical protein
MDARDAERFAEGTFDLEQLQGGERAIAELVRKSVIAPARLDPTDLFDVTEAYGASGTMEITAVLTSFHFINRIADMVGIQSDLPLVQPRWSWLRRFGVRLQARFMRRFVDLSNRQPDVDVESALAEAAGVLGPLPAGFAQVREAPNVAAFLTTVTRVAERLEGEMLQRVTRAVANALPTCEEEATGFHVRPAEPLEALAFVGTRYAVRTTQDMVDAVRKEYGWGDAELTDSFYAIAMRNGLERMNRLLAKPIVSARSDRMPFRGVS